MEQSHLHVNIDTNITDKDFGDNSNGILMPRVQCLQNKQILSSYLLINEIESSLPSRHGIYSTRFHCPQTMNSSGAHPSMAHNPYTPTTRSYQAPNNFHFHSLFGHYIDISPPFLPLPDCSTFPSLRYTNQIINIARTTHPRCWS